MKKYIYQLLCSLFIGATMVAKKYKKCSANPDK